jgi:hypothetical protein
MDIERILKEIETAYPEDIFPDTTEQERKDVMKQYPGFIDRTSAMMGRHLAKITRRKLSETDEEVDRLDKTSKDGNSLVWCDGCITYHIPGCYCTRDKNEYIR